MKKFYLFLIVQFMVVDFCFSQQYSHDTLKSEQLYVVTKLDGTEYIGKILSDDGREVLIETEALGKIYIPKSDIKSIVKIEDIKSVVYGEYQAIGPFTTRYAFTTNALPIVKGENYALINLYGPEVHFALTDHFNIGIMSTWIASPMVIAVKYSFKTKNENVNFSLGTLMGTSGYLNAFRGFGGLHFGNITLGNRKQNLTLSGGYAYIQTGSEVPSYPEQTIYDANSYYDSYYYNTEFKQAPLVQGPLVSIAGITNVGAKASFVFDSMIGLFNSSRTEVITTTITEPVNGFPGYYMHQIMNSRSQTLAMFLMPGMRFQAKEKMAFQVSLAGVTLFRLKGFSDLDETVAIPIPMCTWFFRF